jgi:hypothetical protein
MVCRDSASLIEPALDKNHRFGKRAGRAIFDAMNNGIRLALQTPLSRS